MTEPRTYARPRRLRMQRDWAKQARDAARSAGRCTTCRKQPAEPGKCRCVGCNQAHRGETRTQEIQP